MKKWQPLRDILLFVGGMAGVANEAAHSAERPTLLLLYAAMMGLPAFLRADEREQDRDQKDRKDPPESDSNGGDKWNGG